MGTPAIPAALAAAQRHLSAFLTDLRALVNIDSGSYTPAGVEQVAAYLRPRFEELGCAVELHPGRELGPQLVARRRGGGRGRVLLVGHMDTVFPAGEVARRPYAEAEGRAYGPGVFDMKSGLLVGLYALRLLLEGGEPPFSEFTFLCNSDEEIGSPESHDLVAALAGQADAALVLEPTSRMSRVTAARKGVGRYRLDVTGISSHAGVEPHKGRNALHELAHRIIALQALNGTIEGVTVNVGVAHGGERPNVVPDWAYAEIDIRAASPAGVAATEAALQRVAAAAASVPDTQTSLSGGMNHLPFQQSPQSARLEALANAAAHELGFELKGEPTGGGSDGNTTANMGVATLDGLGLVGSKAHNPGEYVEISSIAPRVALMAGILRQLDAHPLNA